MDDQLRVNAQGFAVVDMSMDDFSLDMSYPTAYRTMVVHSSSSKIGCGTVSNAGVPTVAVTASPSPEPTVSPTTPMPSVTPVPTTPAPSPSPTVTAVPTPVPTSAPTISKAPTTSSGKDDDKGKGFGKTFVLAFGALIAFGAVSLLVVLCAKGAFANNGADESSQQARWRHSMTSSQQMDVEMSTSEKVRLHNHRTT